MDTILKQACLEEISFLVFDTGIKVNAKLISNNYNVNLKNSSELLEKWISEKMGKQEICKEYLIKGTDNNGNAVITIIPEKHLTKAKTSMKTFVSSVYSIESPSNCKKLDIPDRIECKVITLVVDGEREISVPEIIPEQVIEVKRSTPKNVSTMFSNQIKKEKVIDLEKHKEKEEEKINENDKRKNKVNKEKQISPVEPTPKKANSTKSQKNTPLVKSIASFFSKQSVSSNPKSNGKIDDNKLSEFKEQNTEEEKGKIKENNKEKEVALKSVTKLVLIEKKSALTPLTKPNQKTNCVKKQKLTDSEKRELNEINDKLSDIDSSCEEVESSPPPMKSRIREKEEHKKTLNSVNRLVAEMNGDDDTDSDKDIIANTTIGKKAPTRKRQKKNTPENGNLKKKSRIVQLEDSTDDEVIESSFIEDEIKKSPLKIKHEKNIKSPSFKKNKAKRMVSKTYEDHDGYIKTVKKMEDYSCSDDETDSKKHKPELLEKSKSKVSPIKTLRVVPKQKQGSIISFFAKK